MAVVSILGTTLYGVGVPISVLVANKDASLSFMKVCSVKVIMPRLMRCVDFIE